MLIVLLVAGCGGDPEEEAAATADADGDGVTVADGDCDDHDDEVFPGADDDTVDGVDQDCDELDGPDADGDGYADGEAGGDDCDDQDADVHPGADEVWEDGVDQDCDGLADVEDASCTADLVMGVGVGEIEVDGCTSWEVLAGIDFDPDRDPEIRSLSLTLNGVSGTGAECLVSLDYDALCGPGYYDLRDDDEIPLDYSSGTIITSDCPDVAGPLEGMFGVDSGYLRLDAMETPGLEGAGSEDPISMVLTGRISAAAAEVSMAGDFALALTVPTEDVDASPVCLVTDGDDDGDGYVQAYFDGDDCDDTDPRVNPGADETWYDGIDQDCAGGDDYDADGDGHAIPMGGGGDCDDTDPSVHPLATEVWYDGVDQDCDGANDDDADGDGFLPDFLGGDDCDDEDADLNPGDFDGDGWSTCHGDCDDLDVLVLPWDSDDDGVVDACGWTAVAAGYFHSCGVDAGGLECWGVADGGKWDYGQVLDAPIGEAFASLHTGSWVTCGLDHDGRATCWGDDRYALDDLPSTRFADFCVGEYHGCGIDRTGNLACWGADDASTGPDYGQVNDTPSGTFSDVACGLYHNCAVNSSGDIECWGRDWKGETSAALGTYTAVAAGGFHGCALDGSGAVTCWGDDRYDQVSGAPAGSYVSLEAGAMHTCALDAAGGITCWGYDLYGSVDDAPVGSFTLLDLGQYHGCAISTDGELVCWGADFDGSVDDAP